MSATGVSRILALIALVGAASAFAQTDPGVRPGGNGAGAPLPGLTANELVFFDAGRDDFAEAEGVGDGLGPRFNLDGCGACHLQPDIGGTSPPVNPQVDAATAFGARNTVPSFLTRNGPIREARFKRLPNGAADGGVHGLFVITGRNDSTGSAAGCNIVQENFAQQVANQNVIFRIPTPVFGLGSAGGDQRSGVDHQPGVAERAKIRTQHHRPLQSQRQRRPHLALWLEGTEPVRARVLRRGIQRGDGHHE